VATRIARAGVCARRSRFDRASQQLHECYRVAINASVSWSAIAGVYDSFTHVDAASELKIIHWATSNYQSKKPATPSAEFSPVTIEFAPPRTNRIFSGVR
jgi:glycine cleavage system regulatory protein